MTENVRIATGASEERLDAVYDTALLDLDGVVYAGGEAVAHAVDALATAREGGMHLAYVTNNALRPPAAVAAHLSELGVPADAADVITSAQAVARLIADEQPEGARVLLIGGEGLRQALVERGLVPVESADDAPVAVAQGYGGPDFPWSRFAEAGYAVRAGVPWYASNTDLTIPSGRGIAPGNGAAVEVVRIASGGEPKVAGKPLPPMHRETILRTGAKRPLVVGDRLDTDIEGAYAGGVDSLLVLTGVTDAGALLRAVPEHRPTYVGRDLRELLVGHEAPRAESEGAWVCGAARGRVRDGVLELERGGDGDGAVLDGLRVLCAAAWSAGGARGFEGEIAGAVKALGLAGGLGGGRGGARARPRAAPGAGRRVRQEFSAARRGSVGVMSDEKAGAAEGAEKGSATGTGAAGLPVPAGDFAAAVEAFARAVVSGDSAAGEETLRGPAGGGAVRDSFGEPAGQGGEEAASEAGEGPVADGTFAGGPVADGPFAGGPEPLGVEREATGDARVDGLLGRLGDLDELPLDEHLGVYEETHEGLRGVLAALDAAQGPPSPAGR